MLHSRPYRKPLWGAPKLPDSPSNRMDVWKGVSIVPSEEELPPEFKDEAVKMVIETSRPIARVAKELGINEGTLGNWVGIYRRE